METMLKSSTNVCRLTWCTCMTLVFVSYFIIFWRNVHILDSPYFENGLQYLNVVYEISIKFLQLIFEMRNQVDWEGDIFNLHGHGP
ncbi:hypothetical protein L9F63_019508, partial [Diploptera punctata]